MSFNFDHWDKVLPTLEVGMRRLHWTGDPDMHVGTEVVIVAFDPEYNGWPVVTAPEYPSKVIANPCCLLPLSNRKAKGSAGTFF